VTGGVTEYNAIADVTRVMQGICKGSGDNKDQTVTEFSAA
jgi:hypothetical protein